MREELQCNIHPENSLDNYRYVVICSYYQGKWLLSKHRKRDTWEMQGGHIEEGETPHDTAKRELYEESGVREADLYYICDYEGYDLQGSSNGAVFLALIRELGSLPESEMEKTGLFEKLPRNLTYPHVAPIFAEQAEEYMKEHSLGHTIEIRPIQETDDMLAVSNVYERSWKYAYRGIMPDAFLDSIPTGQWANGLKQPGRFSLVLVDNGKICGSSSYCHARMKEMQGYGEIVSIYLLPEEMHKGYGRQLMQAVLSELSHMGYQKAYLWVLEENKNARRFYERFGFVQGDIVQTDTYEGKELREVMYVFEAGESGAV